MTYFKTSQEWLEQSILLLEARPTTVCLLFLPSLGAHVSRIFVMGGYIGLRVAIGVLLSGSGKEG